MDQINFSLHPHQLEVFNSSARFKVVVAGRRSGKSHLAAVTLLVEGMKETNSEGKKIGHKDIFYVSPTQQMSRDIMWSLIKRIGEPLIESTYENTMVATLKNGRKLFLKGSDKPDSLRGVGLAYAVLDEYASMKPDVWELVLRPTLADVKGGALFISTPAGKNHLYDLYHGHEGDKEWANFSFGTADNPYIPPEEIAAMRFRMSTSGARQELDAIFESGGGQILNPDDLVKGTPTEDGSWYIGVDLAGFSDVTQFNRLSTTFRKLDQAAIACVQVGKDGWHIGDIIFGRWDVRETSIRILRACQRFRPVMVGIERGALKNAVTPYIHDQMRRANIFPQIVDVTHGGKKKADRIAWALQGRLQNKRITYAEGRYLRTLRDQMADFPAPLAHDDLVDALSFIDQLATVSYNESIPTEHFFVLDEVTGY